jgi:nucleoside 2-deoxyribosyltransferase
VQTHGCAEGSVAPTCLAEVAAADTLFAWIDRRDTIGTLVEIGAAYATKKPIFVAFADEALSELFYFAEQLATVAVITADVKAAWDLFARWRANS